MKMTAKNPKLSLKSLQDEVNLLRDELGITKVELVEVKEELDSVKRVMKYYREKELIANNAHTSSETIVKCKICDNSFTSKKNLKKHNLEKHKQHIKCTSCSETFEKNCNLEMHIKQNHVSEETFRCDVCEKDFSLKWRMIKHQEIHSNQSTRKCHYFNNDKCCPFEEIGCMFNHSYSGNCFFGMKCRKVLCPFQHKRTDEEDVENVKNDDHTHTNELEPIQTWTGVQDLD